MLDINASFVVVLILVWALMLFLDRYFFTPVGKVIHDRESRIERDKSQLENTVKELENKTAQINDTIAKAKRDAMRIREERLQAGEEFRATLVNDARSRASTLLAAKMGELQAELLSARAHMQAQLGAYTAMLKQIILKNK
jgi:F-type H+-transporting ATPase subunit b